MRISAVNDETIFPNAAPMITPVAMSTTFPRIINFLNSSSNFNSSFQKNFCRTKLFVDTKIIFQQLFLYFAYKHLFNYIGFGDITSDYSGVLEERNIGDPDYLEWASKEDIINFKKEFVGAITDAVRLSECANFHLIYKMMKLCLNKRIASLLVNRQLQNYRQIADMLYYINDELQFHTTT